MALSLKYKAFQSRFDRLVVAVKRVVGEVARGAFAKDLISSEDLSDAENQFVSEGPRASRLLSLILNKISEREDHFDTFVAILHGIPVVKDLADELWIAANGPQLKDTLAECQLELVPCNAMQRFAMYLKGVYKSARTSSDKFPHLPYSKFINLTLVKKELVASQSKAAERREAALLHQSDKNLDGELIKLEDMLNPTEGQPHMKCVFLEGSPGIGKSTCVWELCRRWDEIDALKKYSLIILVRLREKQEARNVYDLYFHESTKLRHAVAAEIEACEGRGVLFVLDGFDELPASLRRWSVFVKLIQGTYLSHCTVLVTSRPTTTKPDLQSIAQYQIYKHIEVVGFTQEQIEEYARTIFASQSDILADFLTYISTNPVIRSMMYIPLNSAIVVETYRYNRAAHLRPIPQTMTQLYVELSLTLLKRHLDEENPLAKCFPKRLEDLPPWLLAPFLEVAELAFKGLERNEMVFYGHPVSNHYGFMKSSTDFYMGEREAVYHSFSHLTLQEFLAAFYISQLSPSKQKKLFKKYYCTKFGFHFHDWDKVWMFVAGLTGFSEIGWEKIHTTKLSELLFLIRCLHEAQGKVECSSVLRESECELSFIYLPSVTVTALDFYAIGYCIANSACMWKLNLDNMNPTLGSKLFEMLKYGLVCSRTVKNKHANIIELTVYNCNLNSTAFNQLAEIVPLMTNLRKLDISCNEVVDGGLEKLLNALLNTSKLETLKMGGISIGCVDGTALSQLLSSSNLKELQIGHNNMSSESRELMFATVLSPTSLECVVFWNVNWTDNAIELLGANCNINKLCQLHNQNSTFITSITKALCKNGNLKELALKVYLYVELDDKDILSLSEMLKYNKTLEYLTIEAFFVVHSPGVISQNQILTLNSALKSNKTLKRVEIRPLSSHCDQFTNTSLDPRFTIIGNVKNLGLEPIRLMFKCLGASV